MGRPEHPSGPGQQRQLLGDRPIRHGSEWLGVLFSVLVVVAFVIVAVRLGVFSEGQLPVVVLTSLLLSVTAYYAVCTAHLARHTRDLADATYMMVAEARSHRLPMLIPVAGYQPREDDAWQFAIENVGLGPAFDVSCRFGDDQMQNVSAVLQPQSSSDEVWMGAQQTSSALTILSG